MLHMFPNHLIFNSSGPHEMNTQPFVEVAGDAAAAAERAAEFEGLQKNGVVFGVILSGDKRRKPPFVVVLVLFDSNQR